MRCEIEPWRSFGPLALCCVLIGACGCGTSNYNALTEKRLNELRYAAPFQKLFGPTSLPDTPVRIRVPMAFKNAYTETSGHPDDGGRIAPDRVQPPFLKLPGFKMCYEGIAGSSEGQLPFYCYLAAVPAKPGDQAKIEADLLAKLKAQFKDEAAESTWEAVTAKSPEGKPVNWNKLRVTAKQPFKVVNPSLNTEVKTENKSVDAIFELWTHDAGDYLAIVGWRVPGSLDQPSGTAVPVQPAAAVPGQPPAAAKPDMTSMPMLTAGTIVVDATAATPE